MKDTIAKYKKRIWTKYVSPYIRLRDCDEHFEIQCCTCNTKRHWKKMHAGHFKHGNTKQSYFYEKNVHGQCVSCNMYRSGNLAVYCIFLESKYGHGILQEIDKLADSSATWNWNSLEYIELEYKEKLEQLMKKLKI